VKKATITPVLDHAGVVGVIVEFGPNHVDAYYVDGKDPPAGVAPKRPDPDG
jgi:hypothetical protein